MTQSTLDAIRTFLHCQTPDTWVACALEEPELLLIDHANCEKKAASTALSLMYRYVDNVDLLQRMSKLAREELHHFEQVLDIMTRRGITYRHITASRYAGELRQQVRAREPEKLVDTLIVGAYIEARSCERFARLAPYLDEELGEFYRSLLRSEGRHFRDYLALAQQVSDGEIGARVEAIGIREAELIRTPDREFRFHSGPVAV